jgi:hypothetical protein
MNRFLLSAAFLAAIGASPAFSAAVTVADVGSILDQSKALPAEATPGVGIPFAEFFTFSLPTTETITVSMSDSAIGNEKIVDGVLSVNTHVSTGSGPLFIPAGALVNSTPLIDTAAGQEATLGPDILGAGAYFVELSGSSGLSPIQIAVDGTITGTAAVPEPSTWVMLGLGFAGLGLVAARRRGVDRNLAVT